MAFLFAESFDFYELFSDITAYGPWQTAAANTLVDTTTRFNAGRALRVPSGTAAGVTSKAFEVASSNTVFLALAHRVETLFGSGTEANIDNLSIELKSGSTVLFTIGFNPRYGNMFFWRGAKAALVATYPLAFPAAVWNHFQFKIVLDSTSGSIAVRKNGDSSDTFAATGLNTTPGATTINGININTVSGALSQIHRIDDVLVFDNTGAVLNDWCGDIRAYTLYANGDTAQKDFVSSLIGSTIWTEMNAGNQSTSTPTNVARAAKVTIPSRGTVGGIRIGTATTSQTGNFRVYVYADDGGALGTLLHSSDVLTNPVAVAGNFQFTFATPFEVQKDEVYWVVATHAASTVNWYCVSGSTTGLLFTAGAITPTVAPDNPAGVAATVLKSTWGFTYSHNASAVNEALPDGDLSFVSSATVGAMDLYDFDNLPSNPAAILAVQARAVTRKSDAAARSAQLIAKSGSTEDASAAIVQSTTYTAIQKAWPVDPNTGAQWTPAAVNALKLGVKVSA